MADDPDIAPTIIVNDSPIPDQLWAGMRQIAPAVVAFAVGRHLLADDMVTLLAVLGGVVWPVIAGQLKTRRRANQLVSVANDPRVPDEVVRTKAVDAAGTSGSV